MSYPTANPNYSMKSTWRRDRSQWTYFHWLYEILDVHPSDLDVEVPVHSKEDPMPYLSQWQMHRWVLVHALIPLAIHHAYVTYTGRNLSPVAAVFFYSIAFKLTGIREIRMLRHLSHTYGFLDGDKHERDGVPDVGVAKVLHSLISTSTFRPMMSIFLSYRSALPPASIHWAYLPLEIGLYSVILDFWFYWYHRLMHEVASLWKYHRTHHLTKHPNPLLTLYADVEQEIFDIAAIPLLAWASLKLMGLPMGFYEWWICHMYVVFAELAGHSGLRVHSSPPSTVAWLLRAFDAELVIEDHDLHHRHGWKKAHNYGKQTRLWDRLFGTCHDRIESAACNVDYNDRVTIPLVWNVKPFNWSFQGCMKPRITDETVKCK
jgi:sterol desaturase/sphingolipid hydroxylase (fatty acid hydroxylase superfamily)